MSKGNLTIHLCEGALTRDTEFFGKMDPYAIFTLGSTVHKSTICDDQGKVPKWIDQRFDFEVDDLFEQVKMEIFDKDVLSSDNIGNTLMHLENLIVNGGTDNWHEIYYKKKSAGKIRLVTKWTAAPEGLIEETKEAIDLSYKSKAGA